MEAAVTGATGFIGSTLALRLLSRGMHVRILVRGSASAQQLVEAGAEICVGDVTDPVACDRFVESTNLIFHCAGVLGGWGKSEKSLWDVNFNGTKNMLEAARKASVGRFVHVSSCGIFGPLRKGEIAADDRPYNPTNIYEKTKAEAEKLALASAKDGAPVTVVRPEFVYGPGDLHLLPFFRTVKGRRFFFFGDGSSLLHPTYIDDVVDGMVLASKSSAAVGQCFNIAGAEPVSVGTFVHTMCDALNAPYPTLHVPVSAAYAAAFLMEHTLGIFSNPPLTRSRVEFLSTNRASSIEKARKVLGYSPKVGIGDGLKKTVGWYREKGLL
jgi:nucleoside-diphosphate-sugar epimerase